MDNAKENIKKEFEEKLKSIEENDKKIKKFKTSLLYIVSILVFLSVLFGTILSYKNYLKAKEKQASNQATSSVLELNKIK